MAKKIKLTRPELKKHRDSLERFGRYLPMIKLKQKLLQLYMRDVEKARRQGEGDLDKANLRFDAYQAVLADRAGLDVRALARPAKVITSTTNIAGVNIPVYQNVEFPQTGYSLFSTPPWVDKAIADLREIAKAQAKLDVIKEQYRLLQHELTKIIQRVNLFEKVKIPQAVEAIRVIRIYLGDLMTAAVGRAKIAKAKLSESITYEDFVHIAPEDRSEST